jgi:hypothetical protein
MSTLVASNPTTARPVRVFDHDRRCSRPGCITVLCHYNPGPECFVHDAESTVADQRREAAERDEMLTLMCQNYGVAEVAA